MSLPFIAGAGGQMLPVPGMSYGVHHGLYGVAQVQQQPVHYGMAAVHDPNRHQGALIEWNIHKACGFIESPEYKRIFAHKSEFESPFQEGFEPTVGTPVSFTPGRDPKSGKERARTIRVEGAAPQVAAQMGYAQQPQMGYAQQPQMYQHQHLMQQHLVMQQQQQVAMMAAQPGQRWIGTLKDWSDEKACGFIDCIDPPGKKLFCHKSDFAVAFPDGQGPALHTTLNFVLGRDSRSGKERAQDIHIGMGSGRGAVAESKPRIRGTLQDWNSQKACGFIHAIDLPGKRFFAHKSEFAHQLADGEEPPVGCEVNFIIGLDAKSGKERAQDIQIGAGDELYSPRMQGFMQDWKPEKACGFIELTDGRRLFAHKTEFAEKWLDGNDPAVGTPVSCIPGIDAKSGKERAQDIRFEGEGAQGAVGAEGLEGAASAAAFGQRLQGHILEWRAEKGCGFIEAVNPAGKRFFAHKTEFAEPFEDGNEPAIGTEVTFLRGTDPRSGRERAQDITIETAGQELKRGFEGDAADMEQAQKRARGF